MHKFCFQILSIYQERDKDRRVSIAVVFSGIGVYI